jgi:hypothetical protein
MYFVVKKTVFWDLFMEARKIGDHIGDEIQNRLKLIGVFEVR